MKGSQYRPTSRAAHNDIVAASCQLAALKWQWFATSLPIQGDCNLYRSPTVQACKLAACGYEIVVPEQNGQLGQSSTDGTRG
jgi:hypothetical protein